jgi:predicted NBD/HSP70 family sugar kinase
MTHYAGIDVSLETSSICIVDGSGTVLRELRAEGEPEALAAALWRLASSSAALAWRPGRCRSGSMPG